MAGLEAPVSRQTPRMAYARMRAVRFMRTLSLAQVWPERQPLVVRVAVGSVMMLGIGLLILQLKTDILISASLNVGHVSRSEDKKRIILLGVEREYCLPDVALCRILNLPVAANIQCAIHRFCLRWCGLSSATSGGGNHDNRK